MVCSEKELGLSEAARRHPRAARRRARRHAPARVSWAIRSSIRSDAEPPRPPLRARRRLGGRGSDARQGQGAGAHLRRSRRRSTASQRTSVTIEDKDLCPRYLAGIVERVKVGPSPEWMQERLHLGRHAPDQQRRRHNQLRHAGDGPAAARLRLPQARRRPHRRPPRQAGREDPHHRRLDRELTSDMLVIADAQKPVAVAGVMGGYDAEVTPAPRPSSSRPPTSTPSACATPAALSACAPRHRCASRRACTRSSPPSPPGAP